MHIRSYSYIRTICFASPAPAAPRSPRRAASTALPSASPTASPPQHWPAPRRSPSGRSPTLLAQPDFQELVACLKELEELPEEERLRQLERQAWCVLELALADSDWRAAAFIADQIRRGFNPARILAQGVVKAQARAAAPPKPREAAPSRPAEPRPSRPYDPIRSAISRATAVLRDATAHEAAIARTPQAASSASTTLLTPATAARAALPAPAARNPRLGALAARLRAGTAAAPAAATDPRGLLRTWAQGP